MDLYPKKKKTTTANDALAFAQSLAPQQIVNAPTARASAPTSAQPNPQIAGMYKHLLGDVPKEVVNNVPQNSFASFGDWYKAATTPSLKTNLSSREKPVNTYDGGGGTTPPSTTYGSYGFTPSNTYLKAMEYTNSLLEQLSSGRTSYTDQINALMEQINNRESFSYDANNDTLFQNYLASMQASGAQAMQDTMGQAAALTGGYGSTYSTAAGNQAYNAYIQGAYDNLPEYYGAALDTYNAEGNALYNKLGMYQTADDIEYNRLASAYSANAQAAAQMYDNEYNNYWQGASMANDNYWRQTSMDNDNYWKQLSLDYQKERDAVSDSQWQQQMMASASKKSAGTSEYKEPSSTQYQKLLELYNTEGEEAVMQYVDSLGENIDTDKIATYLKKYGVLPIGQRTFTLDTATENGFGGLNRNNVVSDQYGNSYKLVQLRNELMQAGMSKEEAEAYIEQLNLNRNTK